MGGSFSKGGPAGMSSKQLGSKGGRRWDKNLFKISKYTSRETDIQKINPKTNLLDVDYI